MMATARSHPMSQVRLKRLLTQSCPPELAEVLTPALRWRTNGKRAIAEFKNEIWHATFHQHVAESLTERLHAYDFELHSYVVDAKRSLQQASRAIQRFDQLVVDPGNEFAISAARQILESPGVAHNPLFLHGPSGSGKTAVLEALANEFTDLVGREQVITLSGSDWVARLAQELAEDQNSQLAVQLRDAVLIILEDVQHLSHRALAQEQLFVVINQALENGQQLVFSADQAPRGLDDLEERLMTRLAWGLVIGLDQPLLETRIALVRALAGNAATEYAANELTELVESLAPDMHQAVRVGERMARGEPIDLGREQTSFDRVLDCVAKHYGLRAGDIAGKRRHRQIAQARQTALLLARRLTGHSLEALGGMVGGRDHSTVLYGIRQAEERIANNPEYRREIGVLTQQALKDQNPGQRRG